MSKKKSITISFDIGGVVSKYPEIFGPIIRRLQTDPEIQVLFLTDMHDLNQSKKILEMNGISVLPGEIINSDFINFGEACKAIDCIKHNIDLHIDDFPGYVAEGATVRLLVMPDIKRPYYADSWKTDGSEGDFGRRKHPLTTLNV